MASSVYQSEIVLNLNSRLFIAALEGVQESQGHERMSDRNNPIVWLAAHTAWSRNMICAILGRPVANDPFAGMFENFKAYDPAIAYPSLETIKAEWAKSSEILKEALASVSEEHLAAAGPFPNPTGDHSNAGLLAFLTQHECYDIGQMAFVKKFLTNTAMKY